MIVHPTVDDELTREFVQGCSPSGAPPQLGLGHVDRPLDPVLADRGRVVEFVVDPGDVRSEQGRPAIGVVEDAAHRKTGLSLVSIDAHDTEVLDRARAGLVDRDCSMPLPGPAAPDSCGSRMAPIRLLRSSGSPNDGTVTSTARQCSSVSRIRCVISNW